MKNLSVFFTLVVVFFQAGCKYGGVVSVLGTPTRHERKIPAEYDLTEHRKQKMLVLVHQPAYLNAQANLRYYLADAMNAELGRKIKIPSECLVPYSELSEFRSNRPDFSLLSPVEVGAALDADMVLLVMIEDYQLEEVVETGFYRGFLGAQTALVEVSAGEKLWPEFTQSKSIRAGFEFEDRGQEAAVRRLAAACAHCTVRCLYDCPKDKFKIADDRSGIGWENWE